MQDLLQANKTINQPNHNAFTWRRPKGKFITKIGHFFEELKVQSRTKIDNRSSAKIRILLAKKKCSKSYSQKYLYPKPKP
jgi:hypothetical protein